MSKTFQSMPITLNQMMANFKINVKRNIFLNLNSSTDSFFQKLWLLLQTNPKSLLICVVWKNLLILIVTQCFQYFLLIKIYSSFSGAAAGAASVSGSFVSSSFFSIVLSSSASAGGAGAASVGTSVGAAGSSLFSSSFFSSTGAATASSDGFSSVASFSSVSFFSSSWNKQ